MRFSLSALGALLCLLSSPENLVAAPDPMLELVQTWPVGVEALRDPALPEAHRVWREMIDGAREHLELMHFYASDVGAGGESDSADRASRLGPVIEAIEAAAARGVRVRFLAEAKFHRTYPEILDRLDSIENIEVRLYDVGSVMGGILHAKAMSVDGRDAFVGSQNFDWRSLEHILELGVRVRDSALVQDLQDVFEMDWALAAGESPPAPRGDGGIREGLAYGDTVRARIVASPRGFLPQESAWTLPHLLEAIGGAHERVRLQFLGYRPLGRDHHYWPDLDVALRDAAARGVRVQLLVSHWDTREGHIEFLQSLQPVPGIEVRILTVPEDPSGFIPYARVTHAKFVVVDGEWSWVGTSNAEPGYFTSSRNLGVVVEGKTFARRLDAFFERGWSFEGTEPVDPCRAYPPPRRGE